VNRWISEEPRPEGALVREQSFEPSCIDPSALKVVSRLQAYGYEAYFVGGCVRDLLLGRRPKDFDVATSATPDEIKRLFKNCRIIGRRFRLAHIIFGEKIIETATFRRNPRSEADEADDLYLRRDNVFGTPEEDARRRDFTVNGLYYDPSTHRLIDYVGGLEDLERRIVRAIGDPDIRMQEDPVRILRAIKFAARLGFDIDPPTYEAMLTHRALIRRCAPARVVEEIFRLLRAGAAAPSMRLLAATGVLEVVLPSLHAELAHEGSTNGKTWTRLLATLEALDRVAKNATSPPTNAFLLATLVRPFVDDILTPRARQDVVQNALARRVRPWLEELHAFRSDTASALELLALQPLVRGSTEKVRHRRVRHRHALFGEAVTLRGLYAEACGETAVYLDEWIALLASVTAPPPPSHTKEQRPHRRPWRP